MRTKKELAKIEDLMTRPSFRSAEALERGVSQQTLAYYVKVGVLNRVAPGVYANPAFDLDEDWNWEDLVQVINAYPQGVVCLVTALRLYELTDERSRKFWIALPNRSRVPRAPLTRFVRYRNMTLGLTSISIGGISVPIFDETRCVLDAFRLLNIEVAIKALKELARTGRLDVAKMSNYARVLRVDVNPYLLMVTT